MTRDLVVRIRADASNFKTQMRTAQNSLVTFGKETDKSSSKMAGLAKTWGPTVATGVAAGAAVMVKAAADFDEGMSHVKATGADAARNIDKLRQAALQAGADTKFSATEAAAGAEELAKAGLSSADILKGGLKGALDLSAAGNLDVAGSAEAAASAMNQFGLSGKDIPHIADLLAAGAGKAQGEVSDMAAALNQAGLVANTFGFSIEETTGVLAQFAASGLTGSDAGTSLKTMLIRLAAPTDVAAAALKKYGIETRNANGELKNASQIAGQLEKAFKDVDAAERDAALATIFGQDAIRGASILYQDGAVKAQKWAEAVDDAGFAADTAATKMDNLKGDLEQLKGSLETLFIKGGGGSQGPLRTAIQDLTDLTNAASELREVVPEGGVMRELIGSLGTSLSTLGPVKGLVKSIQDLMSNLDAGDIAKKTGVAKGVVLRFKTEGAKNAVDDAAKVARAARLTPKQVRSVLTMRGWSTERILAVQREMKKVDRTRAIARIQMLDPTLTLNQATAIYDELQKVDGAKANPKVIVDAKLAQTDVFNILSDLTDVDTEVAEPTVTTDASQAHSEIRSVGSELNSLNGKEAKTYITTIKRTVTKPAGGGALVGGTLQSFADGGFPWQSLPSRARGSISGAGTDTSDSIPAMLSNGEHVLTASDVRKAGGQDAIFRMRAAIQSGTLAFADGGPVGSGSSSSKSRQLNVRGELTIPGFGPAYIEGIAMEVVGATDAHKRQAKARRKG